MEEINKEKLNTAPNQLPSNFQMPGQIDFQSLAQMGTQINMMMHAQQQQQAQAGSFEDTVNYYQHEACRLYIANVVLTNQVKELLNDKNELLQKIAKLEKRHQDSIIFTEEKKKRQRRPAQDIERHYKCPQEPCQKSYGSEGSLAQHIKLKHPEFYQTISSNLSQALSKTAQGGHAMNHDSRSQEGDDNTQYEDTEDQNGHYQQLSNQHNLDNNSKSQNQPTCKSETQNKIEESHDNNKIESNQANSIQSNEQKQMETEKQNSTNNGNINDKHKQISQQQEEQQNQNKQEEVKNNKNSEDSNTQLKEEVDKPASQ